MENSPLDIEEVLKQMDPLGRALFDAACERVRSGKFLEKIHDLQQQLDRLTSVEPTGPNPVRHRPSQPVAVNGEAV
jgi:hypothetical protein